MTTLAAIGRRHSVVITALASDHYPDTNHEACRASHISDATSSIVAPVATQPGRSGA